MFNAIGTALSKRNVEAVVIKLDKVPVTSPPIATFPKKSCAAAFIEANEPLNVVAASLAVVPVMSKLSCITPIAV